ncbi:Bug family tripartite tricarboxylate transporter substrate binding protein [Roseibium marinum]|uniref:Tripartite-type tricarboxylate transporter receptor subunit TctC n=1 Tax=Roseibium marinum TaxID=281252 RepID=A0A2S3UXK8_9HYPH|nr:tripartite tricarboxylate transporter substrate binding protein [Roseibium marinum]POF32189.1 tripartite-type tricarboxylate transporter receptor subunit TctC [Roseibium marinum]
MPSFHWNKIRRTLAAGVIGGLAAVSAGAAMAEDYPTRPITMVVGFPPGGSTDVVARILAGHMATTLGQPVLVENRPGAGGTVGISHVAASAPDGYTLGVSGVGASILIDALGRDSGYDIDNDLDVIGVMGTLGLVIVGRNGLESQTLPELMEYAKANPEALTYGSSGVGTPGHLAMEYLKSLAGVDMLHIPYKGNTPLLNDVVGGHVDIAMLTTPGAAEHVRAENIQPFAVSSPDRSSLMPDVPTVIEGGFEGYTATLWNLLVAPKGTPADVQAKLSDALNEAMKDIRVVGEFATKGLAPTITSPAEATQFLADERTKWKSVIKTAGVTKK